jgi:hypothetical protein
MSKGERKKKHREYTTKGERKKENQTSILSWGAERKKERKILNITLTWEHSTTLDRGSNSIIEFPSMKKGEIVG